MQQFMRLSVMMVTVALIGLSAADAPLKPVQARTILFAPVAVGDEVLAEYPEAPNIYASDMATSIAKLIPGAKAWASASLPVSGDPAWQDGALGATSGAHLVVLTVVEEITVKTGVVGVANSDQLLAKVTQRALDVTGKERWFKTVVAKTPLLANPKTPHPGGQVGKAAWEGCKKSLLALKYWLTQTGDEQLPDRLTPSNDPMPDGPELIRLGVSSEPAGADIYVNDVFRGKTPTEVPLPGVEIQLRLHKDGFQAWSRTLTPTEGMKLAPALEPLAAPAPAE